MANPSHPWLRGRRSRRKVDELQIAKYDPRPEQTSGFFTLSPELRNFIYEMLIIQHDEAMRVIAKRNDINAGIPPSPPALTQVCHYIRSETLPIFYGVNMFNLTILSENNLRMAKQWLREVCDTNIPLLRHIRLRGHFPKRDNVSYTYELPPWSEETLLRLDLASNSEPSVAIKSGSVIQHGSNVRPKQRATLPGIQCAIVQKAARHACGDSGHISTYSDIEAVVDAFVSLCGFRTSYSEAFDIVLTHS